MITHIERLVLKESCSMTYIVMTLLFMSTFQSDCPAGLHHDNKIYDQSRLILIITRTMITHIERVFNNPMQCRIMKESYCAL